MSSYKIIGLRDKVSGRFEGINLEVNEFTAKRNFSFSVNRSDELLFKAKDLELYVLGDFDLETGSFMPTLPMIRLCSGDEVIVHES